MPRNGGLSQAEAKRRCVEAFGQGLTVAEATKLVSRSVKWHENMRAEDKGYAEAVDEARAQRARALSAGRDSDIYQLGFEEWRKRFLRRDTYPHQRQWIDVLEGREPAHLHENVVWKPGRPNRILVNTPPFHAKSTIITTEYVTYRICMNPNVRVLLISKTQEKAKEFLYSIKRMLTSSQFVELQAAYAPEGGFKPARAEGSMWGADKIYVAGRGVDAVDPAAKDPTIQALGIRGHVYGSRADLIILDDCITLTNANEFEKQFKWLNQEVSSRAKTGQIILVGTRVATTDLYSYLLEGDNYPSGTSPWTHLAQPAVLEYAEDPKDWVTLWPRSSQPLDEESGEVPDEAGTYQAWDGPALSEVRESNTPRDWALVYMQVAVSEDSTFHPSCVWGSVDKRRKAGVLRPGEWGGRRGGMEGVHPILSIDPAGTGEAFLLAYGVDVASRDRWVLNAWMRSGASDIGWYADMIEAIVPEYGIRDVVIEQNGYSSWLIHDQRIVDYCRNRGVRILPHYSGNNKQDPDFGVASMAALFGSLRKHVDNGRDVFNDDNMIHLPDPGKSQAVKALVEQLLTWQPGRLGRQLRQDGPMALDVETPIWTTDGWTTMGDIVVGQEVLTPAGGITRVIAKTEPVVADPYRVSFDDKSSLVADGAHRWWATPCVGGNRQPTRWMTTDEIRAWGRGRVMIDRPEPVEMPGFDAYPIDPYVLGVWLGDGTSAQASIIADDRDRPEMRSLIEGCGYATTPQRRLSFGVAGLYPVLRAEGLLCNKHIPQAYLSGSLKQRLSLLQGLMDTDGTVMNKDGRVYFANSNKELINAAAFLARSLGYRVNIQFTPGEVRAVMGRRCETRDAWRVIFTAHPDRNPFRLRRKAERIEAVPEQRRPRHYLTIKSIDPVPSRLVCCITVADEEHQFLAGDELVPTGNCLWFAELRARDVVNGGRGGQQNFLQNKYLSRGARARRMVRPVALAG